MRGEPHKVPSWLQLASAMSWRMLVVVAGLTALVFALSQVAVVALSVFVAAVLASVLWLPRRWLVRHKVPASLASLLIMLLFLGALTGIAALLGPAVSKELSTRGEELIEQGRTLLDQVVQNTPVPGKDGAALVGQAEQYVKEQGSAVGRFLAAGALAVGEVVTGFLLTLVLLFFFLRDGDRLALWLLERTTSTRREDARAVLERAWWTLRRFVGGTAIIALFDALGIGLGLWLIGVPLVLPLMVITFFAAFLPIIGATIAGMLAVLVALGANGVQAALLTLGVVLLVQQFEGNVLEPVVLGRAVPLHPVVILVVITAFGVAFGLVGAFVAVPLAAMISAAGNELRRRGLLGVRATGIA